MEENQAAPDPKKASKGGAKAFINPADTLKDELETIRTVTPQGWILLNFPRNLTQMKLLETSLSGFELLADQPKSLGKMKYEAWAQVISPPSLIEESQIGQFDAHESGIDGVLILETPQEECNRRATGRKIDPVSQIVYHMETNAPEDAKILERLQDFTDARGDQQRINRMSTGFDQAITSIKQWLTKFGLKD